MGAGRLVCTFVSEWDEMGMASLSQSPVTRHAEVLEKSRLCGNHDFLDKTTYHHPGCPAAQSTTHLRQHIAKYRDSTIRNSKLRLVIHAVKLLARYPAHDEKRGLHPPTELDVERFIALSRTRRPLFCYISGHASMAICRCAYRSQSDRRFYPWFFTRR